MLNDTSIPRRSVRPNDSQRCPSEPCSWSQRPTC